MRIDRVQRPLRVAGLLGLAAVTIVRIPGNPVHDVSLRRDQLRYQLVGMLLSHASALALLAGLYPLRFRLLQRARGRRPTAWLCLATLACAAFVGTWLALIHTRPIYTIALSRESGPLEPLQAALYVTASWLAWQCARRTPPLAEERLYRLAGIVCAWLALEEVEYFGIFELLAGGRIHGVWVRAAHDFIALGVRVPAVRGALMGLALVLLGAGLWYIGPRCVLRQAGSLAAVPAALAVVALALSQILDQDNTALVAIAACSRTGSKSRSS